MNAIHIDFSPLSFIKVRLLREPIYRRDQEDWETLRAGRDKVEHYFQQIGLELVMDEAEGYAFLRQLEIEGLDRIPRLSQRRPLSYAATVLLVCLRQEFMRFDTASPDSTRMTKTEGELQDLVSAYLAESTNQVRDVSKISAAIQRLVSLGFLEQISEDPDTYEVMPIIKAKLGPEQLEQIKESLKNHANADTDANA